MGKTVEECYEVLGLDYGATEDEIRSAYRKNALKCHPDKNPDDPLSTQKFQELGHAYRRLTGEEDSDSDDEYDDDDMEIWRDFFFFLFRDEIMSRVRCRCEKCGSAGEHEDDDFLASLAKEQEEQQQFTEEEMAQFTSFANLKEQREANKRKFCGRNQSNGKPEQKATKERKPKLKSNKQLKLEQWKREKEISEIASQINQTNPKRQGKKAFSKDVKTKDLHQQNSSVQPGAVDQEKTVKQHTDCGSNKRNTRKKKNRNKSRQQSDKETDSSQINSDKKTTFAEQKVASSFAVQDAVRNVTVIKPETTRRQDDVTGRLPRYTSYTSPRMTHSRVKNSTLSSQRNTSQKQNGRGWFEKQMQPQFATEAASRPTYGANIWQKRQEKQQFLAELQPSNQNDEELQLQIALELSRKQAEIDAQQREISILEKEMEETLQIEKQFQLTTGEEETRSTAPTVTSPDSFPPLEIPLRCDLASDLDEEWVAASDSEDEWQESSGDSNGDDHIFQADKTSEQLQTTKPRDLDEEQHPSEGYTISGKDNMNVPTPDMQLPQQSREQDLQASEDSCPYGKNCCLGKRCMYSHPPSINNRKSQRSNSCDSQDLCDHTSSESDDRCHPACNLTEKCTSSVASCEELPGTSDLSQPLNGTGPSDNAAISHDESMTNQSLHSSQPEESVVQIPESVDNCTMLESTSAGESGAFCRFISVEATGLGEDSSQCNLASGKRENLSQSSRNDIAGQESQSFLGDRSSSSKEKPKSKNNTIDLQMNTSGHLKNFIGDQGKVIKDGSAVVCGTSAAEDKRTVGNHATVPNVYVIANSQFPFGLPPGSACKQSAAALTPLTNLSAGVKLQNSPQKSQHSSSFPVNYPMQMPAALPANMIPQALTTRPAVATPQTLPATSQNSTRPSSSDCMQTSAATQLSNTVVSSTSPQTGTTNSFPAVPGFPFLPFGNIFPFLNPANAAANASLMVAAAAAGGMPFPITPGPSNSAQNPQGRFTMNQTMLPPYLKTGLDGGVSPLGQYLSMQAQLNGLPGMTVEGNVLVSHPPQHVSVPRPPQHVSVLRPPQPSQAGVTNDPRSLAPTVPQLFRFPYPFVNPQAFANINLNTGMTMGTPCSVLQNQTSVQSGLTPSQVDDKPTEQYRVEHTGPTGVTKPTEVKRDIGQERRPSIGRGSKMPSLRRPATVPKVIQHQASK